MWRLVAVVEDIVVDQRGRGIDDVGPDDADLTVAQGDRLAVALYLDDGLGLGAELAGVPSHVEPHHVLRAAVSQEILVEGGRGRAGGEGGACVQPADVVGRVGIGRVFIRR